MERYETQILGSVRDVGLGPFNEGDMVIPGLSKRGEMQVISFLEKMALAGRIFQVRAGTITTPLVGDVVITDAKAEFCVDAALGYTTIPVEVGIGIRLGTGTLHEYAVKSAPTPSSAGAVFVLLPIMIGGVASNLTARVAAAGGVTVPAELATTTRRHWEHNNPVAVGAGNPAPPLLWVPRYPIPIKGSVTGSCIYVQIAATTTGPSYYGHMDVIELPTDKV